MSLYDETFDRIIGKSLNILFEEGADIYTFALYYDHESHAVEALADTKINSELVARQTNEYSYKYFIQAIQAKDLKKALGWGRVAERSCSLGNFKFMSLCREPMKAPNNSAPFYLAMVKAIIRNSKSIAALSKNPEKLMFCSSDKNNEVAFVWLYREE